MFKEDWNEAESVFEEWWERDLKRPLIQVFSPRNGEASEIDTWAFLRYHPDVDRALDALFSQFFRTEFSNEAYPNVWPNLGPGSLSAYLGAELKFDGRINTAWFQGNFSLADLENIQFNAGNEWWRYTCHAYEIASKKCRDKAIVAFTDLLDAVTVTGQLRGGSFPVNLLKDMFSQKRRLRKALEGVHDLLLQCYEESCRLLNVSESGYSTWAGLWSKRKHFTLQCDVIVYLSPGMFREFVYPFIVEECEYFDRTIWHLDGPLELKHLDDLLSIPELDCIQWIPGGGNPDGGEDCWLSLYKRIQAKGKLIQLHVPPEKVLHILGGIVPKDVAINTTCRTKGEAESLVQEIEQRYG